MSCVVKFVFTFKIESTFNKWAAIFDSEEADKRHSEFDIKPLFRGANKEDPQKTVLFIKRQKGMFKSLYNQTVTGCQLIELTYQQWRNHLGLLHYQRILVVIN